MKKFWYFYDVMVDRIMDAVCYLAIMALLVIELVYPKAVKWFVRAMEKMFP